MLFLDFIDALNIFFCDLIKNPLILDFRDQDLLFFLEPPQFPLILLIHSFHFLGVVKLKFTEYIIVIIFNRSDGLFKHLNNAVNSRNY